MGMTMLILHGLMVSWQIFDFTVITITYIIISTTIKIYYYRTGHMDKYQLKCLEILIPLKMSTHNNSLNLFASQLYIHKGQCYNMNNNKEK